MIQITHAQQIKDIFEPIPADQFCIYDFEDDKGRCCAIGHINKNLSGMAYDYPRHDEFFEGFGARTLTKRFFRENYNTPYNSPNDIAGINNYTFGRYQERDIKARLMHLLNDMIAAGY